MKLIDLLVKELPKRGGWPEYVAAMAQDANGAVQNYRGTDDIRIDSQHAFGTSRIIGSYSIAEDEVSAATDRLTAIITRAQYESALAASEGWIEWCGGECPVPEKALFDVKQRDNWVSECCEAGDWKWDHDGSHLDIIAYRPHRGINSRAKDDRLDQDLNECIGQHVDMSEWNGDGVPPVGIECEVKWAGGKWEKCEVLFVGTEKVVVEMRNREAAMSLCDVKFRPLRNEAEKAREKLAASLHIAAGASPIELKGIGPLYFELADAIISGSVFGTTFKADK